MSERIQPTWTSTSEEAAAGGFPLDVDELWRKHHQFIEKNNDVIVMNPVFGTGSRWYFWDETWTDACGPYPSQEAAVQAATAYAKAL